MLNDFIYLSWFDGVSVALTFLAIVLIQLLNGTLIEKSEQSTTILATASRTPTESTAEATTTPTETNTSNGFLQKQKSEHCEDVLSSPSSSSTSSLPPTPTSPSVNSSTLTRKTSLSSANHSNDNISYPLSIDSLSDEYHEDEDTLSLDNLLPCDQSEIYASKKISFIIDELLQTEMNYVNNLRKGVKNYGGIQERSDLPETLKGSERQKQLLGNIDEILAFHETQILPMMSRNQHDLKTLFDDFSRHFDKNNFYPYVIFTINKKTSMQLRQEHREWFQNVQNEIKDKLGIDSFLVQPIQRLTRYPLLLQQFISEFYKSGINCKPVLASVCKLETRMRRLLEVVNQSEEIPTIDEICEQLNLLQQGYFRKSAEFDAYHHRSRKKYRAKVFLFDRCLLCTEVRKRRLTYRQHMHWEALELKLNTSKSVTLYQKPQSGAAKEEFDFSASEASVLTQWMRCSRKIMELAKLEASQRGKFSLPMDLVLGVLFAIWLIWQYLY